MSHRRIVAWVLGGALTVALLGITGCQSTPKAEPQALTGEVKKEMPKRLGTGPHKTGFARR